MLNNLFLNENQCISCGICTSTCPAKIFILHNNRVTMDTQQEIYCINCGDCISVCPKGAIQSTNGLTKDLDPNFVGLQPEELLNFLKLRRSVRSYKPLLLSENEKEFLTQIASLAPKGGHTQPIRNTGIVIVENKELIKEIIEYTYEYMRALKKKLSSVWVGIPKVFNSSFKYNINNTIDRIDLVLKAKDQNINMLTYDSPNLILLHGENNSPISRENLTIMEYQLMLGAEALGLGTCFLGWVSFALQSYRVNKSNRLKHIYEMLKIPTSREISGTFSIGQKSSKYKRLKVRSKTSITTV